MWSQLSAIIVYVTYVTTCLFLLLIIVHIKYLHKLTTYFNHDLCSGELVISERRNLFEILNPLIDNAYTSDICRT